MGRLRVALLRLARDLRRAATEDGMTPSEVGVLGALLRCGPLRAGDIAAAEAINPTLASRVVKALEAHGLVERERHPQDGRGTLVRATRAGQAKARGLRARRDAILAERLATLTPDDVAALVAALPALEQLARVPG